MQTEQKEEQKLKKRDKSDRGDVAEFEEIDKEGPIKIIDGVPHAVFVDPKGNHIFVKFEDMKKELKEMLANPGDYEDV